MHYNRVCIEEGLHTRGVFGQMIPILLVAIVRCLANFSSNALAFLFTIAIVFFRHELSGVIYAGPAEMERSIRGYGCDEQTDDLEK